MQAGPSSTSSSVLLPAECLGLTVWKATSITDISESASIALISAVTEAAGAVVDLQAMAVDQLTCLATASLLGSSSLSLQRISVCQHSLLCDVSRGVVRPVVSLLHRCSVFLAVHGLSHPGIRATRRLLSACFEWKGMSSDAAAWCRDCQQCTRAKVTLQPAGAVQHIPVPARRFSHIHIDQVGPLPPSSQGYSCLLTIIDRSTRL